MPIDACISATSSRRRSDERSTSMSFSMRACTERIACSRRRALLELGRLGLDALEHQPDLGAVLAAQAAQLERLLGELAAAIADVAVDVALDPLRAFLHDLLEHLAPLRQELRAERGLEQRQAALVQRHRVAADARGERLARRQREHALDRRCRACARSRAAAARSAPRPARAVASGSVERVDLVQHDEARRRVGAEVVAPDRQVGLGDAGVGAEDEDGRVRASAAGSASARARRRSRSGPACRARPGPACSSGCG